MIKIMLVDDHELFRYALKRLLDDEKDMKVIAEAASGEDAIRLGREKNPDIILLDLKLEEGNNGLEVCRKIHLYNKHTKIIALTAYKDEPYPSRLIQSGASGYVIKSATHEELLRAIREVSAGLRYITAEVAQKIALHALIEEETPLEMLSERELQVLIMITSGQKVAEISNKLHLSAKTINSYRYRVFEKLKVNSDVELTLLALKQGIIDIQKVTEEL